MERSSDFFQKVAFPFKDKTQFSLQKKGVCERFIQSEKKPESQFSLKMKISKNI